ncbi:MAG: SAM-dependent methyltransferase, partial [Gammaproteobacteria bacterium]
MTVVLAVAPVLGFGQVSVKPGINAAYQNADVNRWRGVFERDGREVWDRRHEILGALGLRRGMKVADVGA